MIIRAVARFRALRMVPSWLRWFTYRVVMRVAHRYNWHYAPPIYPDGDIQLWCTWCGFRQTIYKAMTKPCVSNQTPETQLMNKTKLPPSGETKENER